MRKLVPCPVCHAPVEWTAASRFRPFCSERCKTLDLGDWAAERHVISGPAQAQTDAEQASRLPPARD